ncbi:MAG: hypothetical protein ABIW48_06725 [Burkholderiales bacterium]
MRPWADTWPVTNQHDRDYCRTREEPGLAGWGGGFPLADLSDKAVVKHPADRDVIDHRNGMTTLLRH